MRKGSGCARIDGARHFHACEDRSSSGIIAITPHTGAREDLRMTSRTRKARLTRRTFTVGLGAGFVAGTAPFAIGRAANAPLKVGVLLPRSGVQAGIGQDCWRGAEIANPLLKQMGLPELQLMSGATETNVDVAR